MATNYFNKLRKSSLANTLFVSTLTNLMIFGQPLQEMVITHSNHKTVNYSHDKNKSSAVTSYSDNSENISLANDNTTVFDSPAPKAGYSEEQSITTFYANEKEGVIGKLFDYDNDRASDNFFTIHLPDDIDLNKSDAVLMYELYGLADAVHTTKSINGNLSYGGKTVSVTNVWTTVKENIAVSQLKPGINEFFFNRRGEQNYEYKIKNLKVKLTEKGNDKLLFGNKPLLNNNGQVYIHGIVNDSSVKNILVLGNTIPIYYGIVEYTLENISDSVTEIFIQYTTENGSLQEMKLPVKKGSENFSFNFTESKLLDNSESYTTDFLIKEQAVYNDIKVSISETNNITTGNVTLLGLEFKDLRLTNSDLKNVSSNSFPGYRIKRHSIPDTIPVKISLKYDPEKIPDGYTAKDVRTFFYDKYQRNWKALPVDSLDYNNNEVISSSYTNDTDYINGVIKVPESPETGSFTPTTISDMKYADPSAGVVSIAPPTPNNTGAATTSFPIKLPQGRNGIQPNLEVTYNSEAGNGWMGIGWNLSTQAISVNTKWGVPMFDPSQETELYSMNGADLVLKIGNDYTNPHRQANIARGAERTFYQRKEGSYQQIIRHGSSPSNYWWEVTDKHGNKTFYGGYGSNVINNAVRRTTDGNNIAYWAVTRVQDTYGNYIEYNYYKNDAVNIDGLGITGQEFYIKDIKYTMHNNTSNYYKVDFIRNNYNLGDASDGYIESSVTRRDVTINARNRYIDYVKDLLTQVHISLVQSGNESRIRSYRFDYREMRFNKQQLVRVSEFDTSNKLFYSNTLEYYDDAGSAIIGSRSTFQGSGYDNVSAVGSLTGLIGHGSPLGTSVASGFSFGLRAGVGLDFNTVNVSTSIGGGGHLIKTNQNTRVSFIDINGDGLPDKVYQSGNQVSYRPNLGMSFGDLIPIQGTNTLARTKSKTSGASVDANALGLIGIGKSWSRTITETDNYFTDFNGDGLPDIIFGNRVRFNSTGSSGDYSDRQFDTQVSLSENLIEPGSIDESVIVSLKLESLAELRGEHAQYDHVKVWKAPYTGTISLNRSAILRAKNQGSQPNSFRLTVERINEGENLSQGNATLLSLTATLQAVNQQVNNIINNISVNKGDMFFFRVHNLSYGYGGEVEFNPQITYTSITGGNMQPTVDENGKSVSLYNAKNDFIVSNGGGTTIVGNGTTQINFNLPSNYNSSFSDDIDFVIKRVRTNNGNGTSTSTYYKKTYRHNNNNIVPQTNNTITYSAPGASFSDVFYFYTESTSNVNWEAVNWKPSYTNSSGTIYPGVTHNAYDNNINQRKYWIDQAQLIAPQIDNAIPNDASTRFMKIYHNFNIPGNNFLNQFDDSQFPLKVRWSVKEQVNGSVTTPVSKTFYIHKTPGNPMYVLSKSETTYGGINAINPLIDTDYFRHDFTKQKIVDIKAGNGRIYSAFYIDYEELAELNDNIEISLHEDVTGVAFTPIPIVEPYMSVSNNLYGISYRGWGQFLYNGGLKFNYDNEGTITNPNSGLDLGLNSISKSIFDYESQSAEVGDFDFDSENPDDLDGIDMDMTVRYTLYSQNNQDEYYYNESIIGSRYGYNNNNILSSNIGRFAEANLYDIYVDPATILSGNSNEFIAIKQRAESKGTTVSGNFVWAAGSECEASSEVLNQYIDLNGDRYPDLITSDKLQYTNMRGALSNVNINNMFTTGDDSEDYVVGATISSLPPNSNKSDDAKTSGNKTISNSSAGINESTGDSFNSRQWIDMNGDGLPDKVIIEKGGNIRVFLNTGYGFTEEVIWNNDPNIQLGALLITNTRNNTGAGIGSGAGLFENDISQDVKFTASFGYGFGVSKSTANVKRTLIDVNGDQLPDLVVSGSNNSIYYLNTGNGFSDPQIFSSNNLLEEDSSIAGNVFLSFTLGITFSLVFVSIKITGTPTGGANASFNQKNATLQDINGDGLVDIIKNTSQSGNNNTLDVYLNTVGKTHLLSKVNTPLGGSWVINYTRDGNTYDMPHSKWTMTSIQTHDGFTGDQNLRPNTTATTVKYENPKYDRREREFLGYEHVTIEERNPANPSTPYRSVQKSYHNGNYYLSGALKSTVLKGQNNQVLSEETTLFNLLNPDTPIVNLNASAGNSFLQQNQIPYAASLLDKSRLLIAVARVTSTSYENGQGLTAVKEFTEYDGHGNIKKYIDYGEGGSDTYSSEIGYAQVSGIDNGFGFPNIISVYQGSTLLRERKASYNSFGKLSEVRTKLNSTDENRVSFVYDIYGNLTTVNQLDNLSAVGNTHYSQNINYDGMVNTYPVYFSNSFGETSSVTYEYRFGTPILTTDMNGQHMRTRIDNRGRILEITGPNEMALEGPFVPVGGGKWTIRMQYKDEALFTGGISLDNIYPAQGKFKAVNPGSSVPTNSQHYAVTRHFDPQPTFVGGANDYNQFVTISIVDGFGQPIQVKKTHQSNTLKWLVSGFEQKDAFGRTLKGYLPITQNLSGNLNSISAGQLQYYSPSLPLEYTEMEYDERDRVTSVIQIGETDEAVVTYSIEDGMFKQRTINELDQTNNVYTDIRGRQRKTVQNDEITTTFQYNAINELKKVINNENFETRYFYDLAGRQTEVQHPDRGVVRFTYDKAGNMKTQTNSKLLANGGQVIDYDYDYGRLVKVTYPQNPHNTVKYTYGAPGDSYAEAENAVGRLLYQFDASGVQVFGYGRMGEVTKNLRTVSVAGHKSYWFFTKWQYDSWNRIQKITYPDGEEVSYHYNQAGMLNSISSFIEGINNNQNVVSSILYDDYGDRASITFGNGTKTDYTYDARRRMENVSHHFASLDIEKKYSYDILSNITRIITLDPTNTLPGQLEIGGPVFHEYFYDDYNRLTEANGNYTGANDLGQDYVQQTYSLTMKYNTNHTINTKIQSQSKGIVNAYGGNVTDEVSVYKNSYKLEYDDYATGAYVTGDDDYGYAQPHAVRTITEYPTWVDVDDDDPRVRHKTIDYDENGNQTEIKETVGEKEIKLRKNLWDEENRLKAVDLKPDEPTNHPIAIYTYDASGERRVRYNLDHTDIASNSKEVGQNANNNIMIYPSGLLMGKVTKTIKPRTDEVEGYNLNYTKHYYIGSERISAKTGTDRDLGRRPVSAITEEMPNLELTTILSVSISTIEGAETMVTGIYTAFNQTPPPFNRMPDGTQTQFAHEQSLFDIYYFHPDHLGSSSYITNRDGDVSQHMEYLPFGETMVDEHLNSYNSPFKFNGKEIDEETGNYYYSARYYDPKMSIFISVDPLAEQTFDSYGYCYNNPVRYIDPTGMHAKEYDDSYEGELGKGDWKYSDRAFNTDRWKKANEYNLQQADGYKEYTTISQRADFYGWFQSETEKKGHETYWAGAANVIATQMAATETFSALVSNEVIQFANDGNKAIFDDVYDNLRDLYNGDILKGKAAQDWDIKTLTHEQRDVVDPIYRKQSPATLKTLEKMAKQQGIYSLTRPFTSPSELKFEGNINSWQDRYNHGMNKAAPFYKNGGRIWRF